MFQVNIRVTQQMNSLVIRWISFQFCECQPHSLFPHLPLSQIDRETVEAVADFIWGAPKSLQMVIAAMKLKDARSLEDKL